MGRDVFLAFSPERVDPGNARWSTKNTPKVLGGVTPACRNVVVALYEPVFDQLVPVSSPEAAELVKLLENTFRSVNIGLANEMTIVCDKLGVDVWEVIEAAATKPFGFMKFTPGPGLGGHCIPIDPHYLAWKMRGLDYKTRFIEVAGEVNSEMPAFWVRKVSERLNEDSKSVRGADILVIGVAYKKDIDDLAREPRPRCHPSPQAAGRAGSRYHDPFVATILRRWDGPSVRRLDAGDALGAADCVVITTDHSTVDWAMVAGSMLRAGRRYQTRARGGGALKVAVVGTGYVGLVVGRVPL